MFSPPFPGPDGQLTYDRELRERLLQDPEQGKLIYPEMARNAVLYGGTDPGRFNPTYMIFCESFIPRRCKLDTDPDFDRRDVYLITQNALADGTYLDYIRAHYNRSAQVDPPFLRDMVVAIENLLLGKEQADRRARGEPYKSTSLSRFVGSFTNVVRPIDDALLRWGARVEARRRAQGVYPPKEIRTPSPEDLNWAFTNYIADVQLRYFHDQQFPHEPKQVRPGEVLNISPDGKVQVAGQTAVMAINGLLTKVIFDKNPDHEFFVEESFPLDWMYPYLTPFGIIMKINRQPVAEITQEMVERDHRFWRRYAARLCGDWIDYDTPVAAICEFVERAYLRGDLRGYRGDVKFVRDNDGQKAFSKLRNSIAGLYYWRFTNTTNPAERERMARESDFAFKQAFAFCPYSPETVTRYIQLLALLNRMDDALRVAQTLQKFDPDSDFARSIVEQVRGWQAAHSAQVRAESQLGDLEKRYATNRADLKTAFDLVAAYVQTGRTNEAYAILDEWVARTNTEVGPLLSIANAYVQIGLYARAEPALQRLLKLLPDSPEIWYDLAGAQAAQGKIPEALQTLGVALQLDQRRRATNPAASNLTTLAATDPRFLSLRELPEFKRLVGR
jgi:tetratricopeptide (TPR) repeat protein